MRQTVLTLSLLAALPLAQAQSAQRQFAVQFELAPLEQMAQALLPVALHRSATRRWPSPAASSTPSASSRARPTAPPPCTRPCSC
jgi:hypothetical protein